MADQFKLTQEEKLMLIDQLIEELTHFRHGLQVVRSDDALVGKPNNSVIYTYQVLGSEAIKKTQTSNLIQKVEDARRNNKSSPSTQQIVANGDDQEEQDVGQQFRYYKNNIRCFRCLKVGHHNYACSKQTSCMYCLSPEHQADRCPQRTVCYQCYQFGHIINECPAGQAPPCQDCKRRHFRSCCFLTKGIEPIKQMFSTDYLYNNENIRCMRCFEYGHLICAQSIQPKPQQFHAQRPY